MCVHIRALGAVHDVPKSSSSLNQELISETRQERNTRATPTMTLPQGHLFLTFHFSKIRITPALALSKSGAPSTPHRKTAQQCPHKIAQMTTEGPVFPENS